MAALFAAWTHRGRTKPALDHAVTTALNRASCSRANDWSAGAADARAFITEHGLTYPSLRDGSDDSKSALEATGVPETYLIDRKGRIALHVAGPVSSSTQLTGPIDQVLAGA